MDPDVVLDRRLDKQTLAPLLQKSDRKGLIHLTAHCGLFVANSAALWTLHDSLFVLPLLLSQGLLLVAFFAPAHETIHRTAFESRWLNTAVGCFAGFLLLLPPNYFRAFHFAHHAGTQDPARDPELASEKPTSWRAYLWHCSGLPYWIYQVKNTLQHVLSQVPEVFITPQMRPKIVQEARWFLGTYGLLAVLSAILHTDILLWLWALPALIGQPFLRLYLLAEHWDCPLVPDMLANTRTTLTNRLVRFLAWNMPYHAEHHAYPAVPFHALPRLHPLVRPQVKILAPGYLSVQRALWRRLSDYKR